MLEAGRKLHPDICYEATPGCSSDSTHQYYKLHKVKRQGKDMCECEVIGMMISHILQSGHDRPPC